MKIEELRIGNLVNHNKNTYELASISGIKYRFNQQDVILYSHKTEMTHGCLLSNIKPIPITEEWLLTLEFVRQEQGDIFDFPIWIYNEREYLFEADGRYYSCLSTADNNEVRYVHQLQNLVYILSGEELKST